MSKQNRSSKEKIEEGVVLLLQVPRSNDKKELAAEQLFASLNGLLTIPNPKGVLKNIKRERISFEIAVINKVIAFYVWVPKYLKNYVQEQIYAQYPSAQISEVKDYALTTYQDYKTTLVSELKLIANDALPIKTFPSFEVDPLAGITASLAKFEDDEEAWIQMIIRPASKYWYKRSERYITGLKTTSTGAGSVLSLLVAPPKAAKVDKLPNYEQNRIASAQDKSQKLAFETSIRIIYRGNASKSEAKLKLQSIISSYNQFNTIYLNGITERRKIIDDPFLVGLYRVRDFHGRGFICNIEEVASLYHLPHTNVETPNIFWSSSQTAEPPSKLPVVTNQLNPYISPIAVTNFRGQNTMFGIPRVDRGRHLYIIGQTGVGKSGLLELLTISDIYSSNGFAIIDPHGDYATNILKRIPKSRINDVVYFNPSDVDYPIAFNPMEVSDPKLRVHTCSELIGVLKRMFDSWGPRLEYILRYSILALLDFPEATMLDIPRILTDKDFRDQVIVHIQDPVVRNFWTVEFSSWGARFVTDAVAPVLNKIGAFTANPLVRNIIGQSKGSFNIRQIMDENKILIVNLSRGLIGEDNASLLGALLVTKIQLAAMSRADVAAEKRTPFYLYVDEFQNFATDSFATILSEARKYGLNLTVANQYIAQMAPQVRDAVFGNVGTIVGFRTSVDDARALQRYFEPKFNQHDLVHMNNRHFVISMTIGGEKVPAFSAITLNLPTHKNDYTAQIIEHSRTTYAINRNRVERDVSDRYFPKSQQVVEALPPKSTVQTKTEVVKQLPKNVGNEQPKQIPDITEFDGDNEVRLR